MKISNEIIEGNKLIAEFMGEKLSKSGLGIVAPAGFDMMYRYDTSFDWLMPVLEKIEKNGCIVEISYSLVCQCRICIIGDRKEKVVNIINDNRGGEPTIYPIWKSVVEYLKT